MTVTERLMKPGQWSIKLKDTAPDSLFAAVREFDHIVVTPARLQPIDAFSDAAILDQALYTGVITATPNVNELSGEGLGYWLGTGDGLGDLLDVAVTNVAGTLSTWVSSLRPVSLAAGTVTAGVSTLTYTYHLMTRREALDHACLSMGAEYRINPDFTLDAGQPGTLHSGYTTPQAVILRKPAASEPPVHGLQATEINRATDVSGYTTKVIVVGKSGDGAALPVGSSGPGAGVYLDGLGNPVVMERLVNAPTEPATNITAYAAAVLGQYTSQRKTVKLQSSTYAASLRVRPGDRLWVFDPQAGFVDTANQLMWQGEIISPVLLRCLAITWPITDQMGVYGRTAAGVYTDLSEHVEYEDGTDTTWQVGTSDADFSQDPTQLSAAYLGTHPEIAARVGTAGPQAVKFLPANVDNNTVAFAGVTGLGISVEVGKRYRFRFVIFYDVALATTGSAWALNGPAGGFLRARSEYSLTATTRTFNEAVVAYDTPAAANASSAALLGNMAIIEGVYQVGGTAGTLIPRFRSEVAGSNISARASGFSYVEWSEVLQ